MRYFAVDPVIRSGVIVGSTAGDSAPPNYAVAIEGSSTGYLDPFYGDTQNRVGTYNITPAPEPSAMALLGVGLAGLAAGGRKKSLA